MFLEGEARPLFQGGGASAPKVVGTSKLLGLLHTPTHQPNFVWWPKEMRGKILQGRPRLQRCPNICVARMLIRDAICLWKLNFLFNGSMVSAVISMFDLRSTRSTPGRRIAE